MNVSHAAFLPYRDLLDRIDLSSPIDGLNRLAGELSLRHDNGKLLRFETGIMPSNAADYEMSIAHHGWIPTRKNNQHDLLNALVWLRFPRLKSALNSRHCRMLENPEERRRRGSVRDQLTLLDESGILVSSAMPALFDLLEEKRWEDLFLRARDEVLRHMTFIVVGHGLLEKCVVPFASMTGKCLFIKTGDRLPESLDKLAASLVQNLPSLTLPPLPIQGIPGWDENELPAYYQNIDIFRPNRHCVPEAQTQS